MLWEARKAPPHSCQSTANTSYERHKTAETLQGENSLVQLTVGVSFWNDSGEEKESWINLWWLEGIASILPQWLIKSAKPNGYRMWHFTAYLSLIGEKRHGSSLRGRSCFRGLMRKLGLNLSLSGSKGCRLYWEN